MDSPQSEETPIDPEALARVVLQCREFHAHLKGLEGTLPAREETPFLYRQLDEVADMLHETLRTLGGDVPILMQDVRAPGFFNRLKKSFTRLTGGKMKIDDGVVDLQGNAWTIPTPEVIGFLANSHKTGVLWVHTYRENFMIEIRNGCLVNATSDRTPDGMRLGEIFVEMEIFDDDAVQRHVELAAESGQPLGSYLLSAEVIDEHELRQALSTQVQSLFHRLMQAENALYRFQEGMEVTSAKDLDLNVTSLLLESARVLDEESWMNLEDVLTEEDEDEGADGEEEDAEIAA